MPTFPSLSADNVQAVITTGWNDGRGYAPNLITSVEGYTIETNLDEDSDPFTLVVGDRFGEYAEMLHRDNEVRVEIFGIGENIDYLMTGIADSVVYSDEGVYVISGRDRSCIATDTICPPITYRKVRASDVIMDRADKLEMERKFDITPTNILGKVSTDGSETEWEFWYRYIRRAGQYMWMEPDGTLVSRKLDYSIDPAYFFGEPIVGMGVPDNQWIPVERAEYHSSKQGRIFRPILYYHNGSRLYPYQDTTDRSIKHWRRKPIKIFEDKSIVHGKAAVHFVEEEIYESKIGALEIKIVIPDPGIIIRQNNTCMLNVPELQLGGKWFIVGTRIIADSAGFTQEVRLREVGFALSKRVPSDPVTSQEPGKDVTTGGGLAQNLDIPKPEWAQCFVDAANEWHGGHEFQWFLACLLAICDHETGFTNERNWSTNPPGVHRVEWFDWDKSVKGPQHGIKDYAEWELSFSNEKSGVVGMDLAVGPMQLLEPHIYKEWADKYGGASGELRGGRWVPCGNIMAAARVLHEKATNSNVDSPPNDRILVALQAYGGSDAYGNSVYRLALQYYDQVKEAYTTTAETLKENDPVEAIQGTVKDIADAILDYHKRGKYRDDNGQELPQIIAMSKGQRIDTPSCPRLGKIVLSPKTLGAIKLLLDNGFLVGTFALATDHSHLGCGSRHSSGDAVDVSSIGYDSTGFLAINHGGAACKRVTMDAMNLFRAQKVGVLKPNQLICNGVGGGSYDPQIQSLQLNDYKDDSYITDDHVDHFHVGY